MIESRVVWKDLGSRRIRKSLEMELGLGDDVKGHGFLMVYTWCVLWNTLDLTFYFSFIYFLLILFSFDFLFLFL